MRVLVKGFHKVHEHHSEAELNIGIITESERFGRNSIEGRTHRPSRCVPEFLVDVVEQNTSGLSCQNLWIRVVLTRTVGKSRAKATGKIEGCQHLDPARVHARRLVWLHGECDHSMISDHPL